MELNKLPTFEEYKEKYKAVIVKLYEQYGCKVIAQQAGISPSTVLAYVRELGEEVRPLGKQLTPARERKQPVKYAQPKVEWIQSIETLGIEDYIRVDLCLTPQLKAQARYAAKKIGIEVRLLQIVGEEDSAFLVQRVESKK